MCAQAAARRKEEAVLELSITEVGFNKWNQREEFGGPDDERLREHILKHGQKTPVWVFETSTVDDPEVVEAYKGYRYGLIAGERRTRTVRSISGRPLLAIVKQVSSRADIVDLTIAENILRKSLNALEEARLMQDALDARVGRTQHDLTVLFGCSMSTVTNRLLLLRLVPKVQEFVLQKRLGALVAAGIAKRKKERQLAAAEHIIENRLDSLRAQAWLRRTELADPKVRSTSARRVRKPSDHRANFLSMLDRYEIGMEEFAEMSPANFNEMFPNQEAAKEALRKILTPYGQTQTVIKRLKKRAGIA